MCGITGFLNLETKREDGVATIKRMCDQIAHRGPDAEGWWTDSESGIHLGHRRLSILDLSPTGAQPMRSLTGRYVLVFNGEIYNFNELKIDLQACGVKFRGSSDTEVLLAGIELWGLKPTLRRANGMFAIALWDSVARVLTIARDRFGEKPLYYAHCGKSFIFSSELKSLRCYPEFKAEHDREAVEQLVMLGYIAAPRSIYRGVSKLRPGCLLSVSAKLTVGIPESYWSSSEMFSEGERSKLSDAEVIDRLERLLRSSVRARMVADVPLGAFLSGGIDSSTIVALMQSESTKPIKTFTIGLAEADYNEANEARKVAKHLGTDHHEYVLFGGECRDLIQKLPEIYDEPFADSSQIPTVLVSAFTRSHVTVALSGDAGDEFFGGYNRYLWSTRLWQRLGPLPRSVRSLGQHLIQTLRPGAWENIIKIGSRILPRKYRVRSGGDKMYKIARMLDANSVNELYVELISNGIRAQQVLRSRCGWSSHLNPIQPPSSLGDIERMMFLDQQTYLVDDILCKVDRASMSVGLEVRVPFLDNDVAAFAWSLPIQTKVRHDVGKWPVRQLLKRYLPEGLFDRPKMGFGIPIGQWLRADLRDWAEDLLTPSRLESDGMFLAAEVHSVWREHLSGRVNFAAQLWPILMFQAWRRRWG